jgi:hypothetical protein
LQIHIIVIFGGNSGRISTLVIPLIYAESSEEGKSGRADILVHAFRRISVKEDGSGGICLSLLQRNINEFKEDGNSGKLHKVSSTIDRVFK